LTFQVAGFDDLMTAEFSPFLMLKHKAKHTWSNHETIPT
jgi:hypothetical protein